MFTGVTAEALTEYTEFVEEQEMMELDRLFWDETGQQEFYGEDEPLPMKPGKERKERRFKRR